MKKMNKKGFTIVELVIVIAVIAILAAVMIPTFGGIIEKANKSSVEQTATAAYKEAYGVALSDGKIDSEDAAIQASGYTFKFTGSIDSITCEVIAQPSNGYTVAVTAGKVTATKITNNNQG